MRRWVAVAPLAVLAGLAALFLGYGLKHDPRVNPAALVGKPLPATPLAGLADGAPSPLAQAAKGPVLVNVFASWCAPCAEEAPALMALKASGVRMVGVAYKDDPAATRGFLSRQGDPFARVLLDPDGRGGVDLGISGVPETFAVDAQGVVRAKHAGALSPDDAERLLEAIDRRPR